MAVAGPSGPVMGREDVDRDRLLTLVSQYAMPAEARGSEEFLGRLLAEASVEMRRARASRLLPWTRVAGPWFLAALIAGVWGVAWRAPGNALPYSLPRLLSRPCKFTRSVGILACAPRPLAKHLGPSACPVP